MKAILNGAVLAQADKRDLVRVEGNWYFPLTSLQSDMFTDSPTEYHCGWKGGAKYYNVRLESGEQADVAWGCPEPLPGANERVGRDISGYVAFDPSVEIAE